MDPVSIVIGVVAGGAVGAVAGMAAGKGKVKDVEDRLAKLEKDKAKAEKALKAGEDELSQAKKRADELAANLESTKKSLKDVESAKKKHEAEAKKLESKAKEAETKASKVETEAKKLEEKAKQVESKAKELEREAAEKAQQVSKLQEDLAKAGSSAGASYDAVKGDLDGILKVLCQHERQEAAVIADQNGIVVAAFGSNGVKEGMAAAANRITKIGESLRGMVEFSQVSTFRISDATNKVIAGRTFEVAGEMLALATVGENVPSDRSLDGAMENLHEALGG